MTSKFLENISGDIGTDDPDNSEKAKCFYKEYWGNLLKRENGLFRGDTIISFNTVAGCMFRLLPIYNGHNMPVPEKRLEKICESDKVEKDIKEKFEEFWGIYHTLANFMPLVVDKWNFKKDCNKTNIVNLNQAKGNKNCDYHEFPDLFFGDIKKYKYDLSLDVSPIKPEIFNSETNNHYFKQFNKWKSYVEDNYLQDFFSDETYSKFVQLAPCGVALPYDNTKKLTDDEKDKCKEQIYVFLSNAIDIIKKRANRFSLLNVRS